MDRNKEREILREKERKTRRQNKKGDRKEEDSSGVEGGGGTRAHWLPRPWVGAWAGKQGKQQQGGGTAGRGLSAGRWHWGIWSSRRRGNAEGWWPAGETRGRDRKPSELGPLVERGHPEVSDRLKHRTREPRLVSPEFQVATAGAAGRRQ